MFFCWELLIVKQSSKAFICKAYLAYMMLMRQLKNGTYFIHVYKNAIKTFVGSYWCFLLGTFHPCFDQSQCGSHILSSELDLSAPYLCPVIDCSNVLLEKWQILSYPMCPCSPENHNPIWLDNICDWECGLRMRWYGGVGAMRKILKEFVFVFISYFIFYFLNLFEEKCVPAVHS